VLASVADGSIKYLSSLVPRLHSEEVAIVKALEPEDDGLVDILQCRSIKLLQNHLLHPVLALLKAKPDVSLAMDISGVVDIVFYAGDEVGGQS